MALFGAPKKQPAAAPVEETKPAETPAAAPIDIKAIVTEAVSGVASVMTGTINDLKQTVTELASRQPQVVVQQPAQRVVQADITDEEIDAAVLSGQGAAAKIRSIVDRAVNATAQRIVREHIDPLREVGLNSMAALSHEVTLSKMPRYGQYKKEIDERLALLDPALRTNPAVLKMTYDAVIGSHADEIAAQAREEAIRGQQDETQRKQAETSAPGTGAGAKGQRPQAEVATAEALGGSDALDALAHKGSGGQSQDAFAQGLGYKDWSDYMAQYAALQREAGNA